MSDLERAALKPCPFCGAQPRLVDLAGWEIICVCGVNFVLPMPHRDPLVAAWNRRSPAQPEGAPAAPAGEPADTLPEEPTKFKLPAVGTDLDAFWWVVRKEEYDKLRQRAVRLQAELADARSAFFAVNSDNESLMRQVEAAERTVAERDKELAAARVNEARYLWLREYHWDDVWDWCIHNGNDDSPPCISPEATDAAIDCRARKGTDMTHNDLKHNDLVALLERLHEYHTKSGGITPELVADKAAFIEFLNDVERRGDEIAAELSAAITALRSGEAVLCPREPTEEMNKAGEQNCKSWWTTGRDIPPYGHEPAFIYRAMLDCAKGKP